jgi:hypothetical protein
MSEDMSTANVEVAVAYLQSIENRVSEEELARFFAPDVVLEQFFNRLVPKTVQSTLADVLRESAQGKKSVSHQKYEVHNRVASGDWEALQVKWEGILAIPVAGLAAGSAMRAWFAMFLQHEGRNHSPGKLRLLRSVVSLTQDDHGHEVWS